jgi:hypothetical protein
MTSQEATTADLALWRPERWIRAHYLWLALAALALTVLNELSLFGRICVSGTGCWSPD